MDSNLTWFIVGMLTGIEAFVVGRKLLEMFKEARELRAYNDPQEVAEAQAIYLRLEATRMLELAKVCDGIANGEDPNDILANMPQELREAYNKWDKEE